MTKPMSFRLSAPAADRLCDLARIYGSKSRALEVAIERLHSAEVRPGSWDETMAQVRAGWLAMIHEQATPREEEPKQ